MSKNKTNSSGPSGAKFKALPAALLMFAALLLSGVTLWSCGSERASPAEPTTETQFQSAEGPTAAAEDEPGAYDVTRLRGAEAEGLDWCRYEAVSINIYDGPFAMAPGDKFCIACPESESCPGGPNATIWFVVYRDGVVVAAIQSKRLTATCQGNCGPFPKFGIS